MLGHVILGVPSMWEVAEDFLHSLGSQEFKLAHLDHVSTLETKIET